MSKTFGYILLLLFILPSYTLGQIPVIDMPKPATFPTFPQFDNREDITRPKAQFPDRRAEQDDMHERDRIELENRNREFYNMLYGISDFPRPLRYDLPSLGNLQGTEHFYFAAEKLNEMLNNTAPISIKEAVYMVENAYFENRLNYSGFNKAIEMMSETAMQKAIQDGQDWNDPAAKNIMLFRIMADTLDLKVSSREASEISYPLTYDFDDYRGEKDWTNMFVSKLLATKKGQCHSMPLLYLILCESVGTEAFLAYSPSHSYVKIRDKSDNWYNLELTNGRIVSDAFIVGSGFITAEAIKNKTYMESLSRQEVIAHCLSDLAMGYIHKYGYDGFVDQCTDSVLKYAPNNLTGLMIKANYRTERFEYVVNQVGRPHPDTLKVHYPKVYELLEERNEIYRKIDNSGYREMPEKAYRHWLQSVNDEKEKRVHDEKYNKVLQIMK